MSIDQSEMNYDPTALRALLHWYRDMGVDVATASKPCNFFEEFRSDQGLNSGAVPQGGNLKADGSPGTSERDHHQSSARDTLSRGTNLKPRPTTGVIRPDASNVSPAEAVALASTQAKGSQDIAALEEALRRFDGCALKKGARHTVFADGTFGSPLLVMGEAPGRDA